MDKKYCDQCGQELNISAQFCSACGASVPSVEKETVGNKVDKIIDKTKSGAGGSSNVKFILIGIIAVLAVLILVFAFSAGVSAGAASASSASGSAPGTSASASAALPMACRRFSAVSFSFFASLRASSAHWSDSPPK